MLHTTFRAEVRVALVGNPTVTFASSDDVAMGYEYGDTVPSFAPGAFERLVADTALAAFTVDNIVDVVVEEEDPDYGIARYTVLVAPEPEERP